MLGTFSPPYYLTPLPVRFYLSMLMLSLTLNLVLRILLAIAQAKLTGWQSFG